MAVKAKKNRTGIFNRPVAKLANTGSKLGSKKEEEKNLVKPSTWAKKEDYSRNGSINARRDKLMIDIGLIQMASLVHY